MRFPENHSFEVIGYDDYCEKVMPKLEDLLARTLQDSEGHYMIAINEAVCNAARYAVAGHDNVCIQLDMLINDGDIKTAVQADTLPFDVLQFRKEMAELAEDENIAEMEWGDYTGHSKSSRGYWYMLMACEYLYIDTTGKKVTLCAKRPFSPNHIAKKISDLVPRLYVEQNGVIF